MCGDYYIGGRRFSSLSDLIGYYSYVSCLLKGEKLLSPVAPPEVSLAPKSVAWPLDAISIDSKGRKLKLMLITPLPFLPRF